ncbi:putative chlorophyll(ide) b reductase NYC1, chloroplastic [Auxenochlorella protothecoides]|uniref:Putative chlorophyll(Ide) b reductase NYC1, chloroplastic n=1 Tax=Auxenochlorella protothecoides TaxID=3075 RepID=A0A087SBX2_AUXPR|nr:putative chlorophyll(ide) b reductase NYC1, chloroplastic [Auxenochlorella protothecoides]KFM23226.1 putative chlorophyll(ide) b reductase NYC1, chloroplastic [Auxenochlorella protothecoides]
MAPHFDLPSFGVGILAQTALLLVGRAILSSLKTSARFRADNTPHPSGLKVVITGGTRGLGLALARQFLALGDDVVICSRHAEAVERTVSALRDAFPGAVVAGAACDVSVPEDVDRLGAEAQEILGGIDIWVANAALRGLARADLVHTSPGDIQAIVGANLTGSLLCARTALKIMSESGCKGKFFLMAGRGSRGDATPKNPVYGATKQALVQLSASLAASVQGSPVSVHLVSPGMVATDLLLPLADTAKSARLINILAEEPETVAGWLVPRLRGATGNGGYLQYLTIPGALFRFATAGRRRNRFVSESQSRVGAGFTRI